MMSEKSEKFETSETSEMSEAETSAASQTSATGESPVKRRRWRRLALRVLLVLVAVAAALFVTFFTIDLGPHLRGLAERQASRYLERPMHIGKLKAKMRPGEFELEDVFIEGLTPQSSCYFLKARKITVKFPWWSILQTRDPRRELVVESIVMTDWDMCVEMFPGGRHSMPKLTPRRRDPKGPKRFDTTVESVVASRGRFTYLDHGLPWTIVTRELNVAVTRGLDTYVGTAAFANGTVSIQKYLPFAASMRSRFKFVGSKMHFDRLDLATDGAVSVMEGDVDFSQFPEQMFRVKSRIDFPTQKNIFFQRETFTVSGQGDFEGTWRLFKKGGFELQGTFHSPLTGVNTWRFPDLRGSVRWLPHGRLEVTNATARVHGGLAEFDYIQGPSVAGRPTPALWDVAYRDISLPGLTDFLDMRGLRLAGTISGRNRFEWGLGRWSAKRGGGELIALPPAGVTTAGRELTPDLIARQAALPPEAGPFNPHAPLGYLPVAGRIVYQFDPDWISLDRSWVATPKTFVEFSGRTAFGERSRIPFHVTSLDWQESDRVLAGLMTAFGAPTGATPLGGVGEFDGVMLHSFRRPRIEGAFSGDLMRAWDVVWGRGRADVVVENSYVIVNNAVVTEGDSEIVANGQFSLGYPRKDGMEELNARVRITKRPLKDLRRAFELDDYPADGLVSGEYHLYGHYETPYGFGKLMIDDGEAYGETFETASASLRFEGSGVRLDAIDIKKGAGGVTGAAWVGWDGNYSFNADGRRLAVESLDIADFPMLQFSGLLTFNAAGTGTFESPRYDVKVRVDDLFARDEGVGQVTGRLALRNEVLTIELQAASKRLAATGAGRIAMTPELDTEFTLRFADTSLDPYLRFFESVERPLSPYTTAIASGTIRAVGELADIDHLLVDVCVDSAELKLFDYRLQHKPLAAGETGCPIDFALNRHVAEIRRFRLVGEGTELQLDGSVSLHDATIDVNASGDASLGILQGFFRDLRSSGSATLKASVTGPLDAPAFSGNARINGGRVRHMSLPHSLEAISGTLAFDAEGIRVQDMTARLGAGQVTFGGRIGLTGFVPGEVNLSATGERMRIRYPEGFVSNIDADLQLAGNYASPLLKGTITVHDALWSRRFDVTPDLFRFRGGALPVAPAATTTLPVRFDLQITADRTLRVRNNLMTMFATADLRLQGTYDKPQLFGRAEIDRGDVYFEGNRYQITRGTLDFSDPARIEPYLDIEAETRARAGDQTYRVTLGFSGTPRNISMTFNADPPLPAANIFQVLLGQTASVRDADLQALNPRTAAESEEELLRIIAARLFGAPISGPITEALEKLGLTSVQISPSIGNETDPLTPSARLIIGQRISDRAYLTFLRALGTVVRDQIIILEYDQNDRLGWVLTQTGDTTFAVDFRVRHRF